MAQIANQTIFTCDNLDIMRGMDSESVDLIYLDPPFNSNRHYSAPIGSKAAGAEFKDAWTFEDTKAAWWGLIADEHPALYKVVDAAGDVGNKGDKAYLIYMAMRLLEMHRILKPTGSIYLHCDPTMSHSLKMVMDAIFGRQNFRNEIIWCYTQGGRPKKDFPRKHDIIFRYSVSSEYVFNSNEIKIPFQLVSEKSSDSFTKVDSDGRYYKEIFGSDKKKKYRYYQDDGKVPYDWWTDIHQRTGRTASSMKSEYLGYPTQKPLALLRRIVAASSSEGEMVLDPFCGCATACLAAEDLHRQWIGIDISPLAATLVTQRMKDELGLFGNVNHRTDIPQRSDQISRPSRDINHTLFGQQEGKCNGCGYSFPFQNFTRDHIVPTAKGGADTDSNLQLLCGRCNSIKGDRDMPFLVAKLTKEGTIQKPVKRR